MTPERYRQLEELCHRALDKPPAERADFIETACAGDEPLRRELESLLASADRAASFLEEPPAEIAAEVLQLDADQDASQRRLLHYQLRSRLGAGGMGEVYLAEDLRLGRLVALKLLHQEAAADSNRRRRLLLEAQAASTLSHANVAHVYEIAEADGVLFIAMEHVPGQTLGALLKERRLPPAEIVSIALQVADALDEAHAKGIIHRDIKPSNVMVTPRGQVKVLDFGLAKMAPPAAGKPGSIDLNALTKTSPGALMGTPEYMSPEQALGLEMDRRTDIFSFGTMLYEMAAGQRPFIGRTTVETLDRIIHAEPASLAEVNPDVPAELALIAGKCLEKDRGRRYPSGKELLAALRALASGLASPATAARRRPWRATAAGAAVLALALALALAATFFFRRSPPVATRATNEARVRLAVLPFENIGAGPERDYLADALTEETIAALGQLDADRLSVIGRTSIMAYKRTTKTLAEIGRELEATWLVECSVRSEANRVRVIPKLIRASDQVQVWSASYDSEPSSMLAFQRELGSTIAEQIRLRLSPERMDALSRRQTRNPQAYDLYLRGRHFYNQYTPTTTRRAIEFFSRATEIDPNYALAWSGLADAHSVGPITGDAAPLQAWELARNAATKAVRADPQLAESQTSLSAVDRHDLKWAEAEKDLRKAIALDPSYPFARRNLGLILSQLGRHAEARQEMQRARELDPLNPMHHALSAQIAFAARDFPAAIQFARQAIVVNHEFWIGHFELAQAYEQSGQDALALEAANDAGRLSGGNSKTLALRGYILARQGKVAEAREVLKALKAAAHERFVPPYAMALVHAGLGEQDAALEWLERAFAVSDVHLEFLSTDPKWDGLRTNPKFRVLLGHLGLPGPEQTAPSK